jgi:hypothetical protein
LNGKAELTEETDVVESDPVDGRGARAETRSDQEAADAYRSAGGTRHTIGSVTRITSACGNGEVCTADRVIWPCGYSVNENLTGLDYDWIGPNRRRNQEHHKSAQANNYSGHLDPPFNVGIDEQRSVQAQRANTRFLGRVGNER